MKKRSLLSALAVFAAAALDAQQPVNSPAYEIHRDVIRGRVTTDSGAALAGAVVAATMAPDRQFQLDTTDADGRYEIVFEKGTGDYLVHVSSPGRIAFRKRVTRTGSDSLFTVDAVLKSNVQVLAPVQVAARRSRPSRDQGGSRQPGVGAAEQVPMGVTNNIGPSALGNLEAIAGSMPGISTVPGGGISVLGSAPSANSVTLNGLDFSGGNVPRSASTNTTISLSTYDPARGGFSGLQTQVSLSPGGANTSKRAASSLDAPQLQAADAIARNSGAVYGGLDLSYGTDGATFGDRWVYNSAVQYKRTYSDAISVANAGADVLTRSGVSPDSAAKLLTALNVIGVPVTGSAASSRVTNYVNFMGRLDRPFFDYSTYTPKNSTWGVLGYANFSHTGAVSLAPTITPATAGEHAVANAGAQYVYSRYFGKLKDQLNETRVGASLSATKDDPYVRLPNGRVLVSSSFADGTSGIASLGFAGNSSLERQSTTTTLQATNQTQFYWKGRAAHPGKLTFESRYDIFSEDHAANRLGAFSFNSLADVQANTPASFSRTLNTPSRSGGQVSGSAAISDNWIATPRFRLLYGLRAEGNVFTQAPENNPAIQAAFGARTDHAPNTMHVSPRVGFNWLLTKASRAAGQSGYGSQMGSFASMARGVIRGGVGEFRQRFEPSLLAAAATSTGLPTGEQRISCVGPSVPTPDWSAWLTDASTIPSSCLGGGPSGFTDASPAVRLFDKDYQPSRSWRANISYGSAIKKLVYSIDAIYSLNLNQPGIRDLNFAGTPGFALPGEGGRTVYVPQSSIVASTGAIAASAARTNPAFGPVTSRVSDLRGNAQQIAVRARPGVGFIGGKYLLDLTYTYSRTRSQARGFDGTSLADPRSIEWAPADNTARHEVYVQTGWISKWVTISAVGKVSSGQKFTPMVGSDINGDGLANDRAFVFDGAGGGNAALGSAMQTLMTSSSQARDCLIEQVGRVAGRNSCEAPWYTTLALNVTPNNRILQKLKIKRTSVDLYISNPLAGLDQAVHGSNLRGWGSPRYPDRTLLYVRGFDSTTNRFNYDVNPKFGDTRGSSTAFRSPFRVTLNVRLDFSRNFNEQTMERFLSPGRRGDTRPKLDSAAIVKRYCANFPDMYNDVINQTDSLLLTRDQVESLRAARTVWSGKLMDYWGKWAQELVAVPDNFDVPAMAKKENTILDGVWALAWTEAQESFPKILTPVQIKLSRVTFADLAKAKEPPKNTRYGGQDVCPK